MPFAALTKELQNEGFSMWCCFPRLGSQDIWPEEEFSLDERMQATDPSWARLRGHVLAGLPEGRLNLHRVTPEQADAWTDVQLAVAGRYVEHLVLPDDCDAATVRRWLKACPTLKEITANHIQGDGRTIHAQGISTLRLFRTEPPGPDHLILPASAQMVVPAWRLIPPRKALLSDWVNGTARLPEMSAADWTAARSLIFPLIDEPSTRYRQGVTINPLLRAAIDQLLHAAPQELLSGTAAENHRSVHMRIQRGTGPWAMGFGEFRNFLRPLLTACWEALTKVETQPLGRQINVPKSVSDLQSLAALRLWMFEATPDESVGVRRRVADAHHEKARLTGQFRQGEIPSEPLLSVVSGVASPQTLEKSMSPQGLQRWPSGLRERFSGTPEALAGTRPPNPTNPTNTPLTSREDSA